jgi:serine/threonine protein kinase
MDRGYETFCLADPLFYDVLHSSKRTSGKAFPTSDRPLPEGWQRREQDDWFTFSGPATADLPPQGWKIHVSACMDNAPRVLDAVWDFCIPRGINFKFLQSSSALMARVSKYAPRGYSAKLVTIYPSDDAACEKILRELGEELDGEPSPYILTDLRWGAGPLYVRYGAFAQRYCVDENDRIVPAIADDTGKLVPDRRDPVFRVPPWVTLPDFLAPHLAARNAVSVADLPYAIDRVVHFSNGGGVYVGTDTRTGDAVVLKEGRPHCGLDAWRHDAVLRVEREHAAMSRLAGIPGVPKVHDLFWVGEHRFFAMEFVEGEPLSRTIVMKFPLIDVTAGPEDFAEYTEWALDIYRQVETTMEAIHDRGLVYGDLHLFNVMVREDDTIALLDFEVATPVEEALAPGLGNAGFAPPPGTTGFDVDRYGLACLKLALFMPMTTMFWLHRPKAQDYVDVIRSHFPVDKSFLQSAVDVIVAPAAKTGDLSRLTGKARPKLPAFEPGNWPELRDNLARAIVASATPERNDRLFPGDIEQFAIGGMGLSVGAAGVLYALSATGAGRHTQLEDWLLRKMRNIPGDTRPGLYDGLHGTAFALDHLGYKQPALDALEICLRSEWESLGLDLESGLAGVGLNLRHFAERTGAPELRAAFLRSAELVAERIGSELPDPDIEEPALISGGDNPYAGLMRGMAGPALLLIRAYEETGDTAFLDRAATALRQDLRRCVIRGNGTMEVNEGWRSMPYLAVGSIGIGLVLDEYLAHRPDEPCYVSAMPVGQDSSAGASVAESSFAEASRRIEDAAQSEMYILPGAFSGRAGILLYLAGRSESPRTDPRVGKQVRGLSWHALPYGDGVAFPGTGLMRLSMDLSTGTAGVLLAMGAALHDQPVHLPLLAPSRVSALAPVLPS